MHCWHVAVKMYIIMKLKKCHQESSQQILNDSVHFQLVKHFNQYFKNTK